MRAGASATRRSPLTFGCFKAILVSLISLGRLGRCSLCLVHRSFVNVVRLCGSVALCGRQGVLDGQEVAIKIRHGFGSFLVVMIVPIYRSSATIGTLDITNTALIFTIAKLLPQTLSA
jgi:hypothetical protein